MSVGKSISLDLPQDAIISDHGGDLAGADALFPSAPKPWLDLSTGINPHSYPFAMPAQTAFTRLPENSDALALTEIAAELYRAPSPENVVAAPGTQILLPLAAALARRGRALVLGPTYAEHQRAAAMAGHQTEETSSFKRLFDADLAIIVNPNNPDGRIAPAADLIELARHLGRKGGLLVVDEAFADVAPAGTSVAGAIEAEPLIVLRSFGKFFGLAGVRLGFAIASRESAGRLRALLGPWAVSGPAAAIGLQALSDRNWQTTMRSVVQAEAAELDALIQTRGLKPLGGTDLFRLIYHPDARALFAHLGRQGILVRRFPWREGILRLGLPGSRQALARLAKALERWPEQEPER